MAASTCLWSCWFSFSLVNITSTWTNSTWRGSTCLYLLIKDRYLYSVRQDRIAIEWKRWTLENSTYFRPWNMKLSNLTELLVYYSPRPLNRTTPRFNIHWKSSPPWLTGWNFKNKLNLHWPGRYYLQSWALPTPIPDLRSVVLYQN